MKIRRGEQGQATPIMAVVLVVAAVIGLGLARLGVAAVDSTRAATAADAAALAGAAEISGGAAKGRDAAARLAGANGGELVSYRQIGSDVLVTVAVGSARAEARAWASRSTTIPSG